MFVSASFHPISPSPLGRGAASAAGWVLSDPAHSPIRANRVNASVISRTASSRSVSVVPKPRLKRIELATDTGRLLARRQFGYRPSIVNRNEFLQKLGQVKFWRTHGQRAPHKPLLVLLALGRVARGEERLARYEQDIERPLTDLLERFGPPRKTIHPEYPFSRLSNDGLWEIPGGESLPATRQGDLHRSGLIKHAVTGGFPESIYELLLSNSELVQQAAQALLYEHFPYSLHDDIRTAAGFPTEFLVQESLSPPYGLVVPRAPARTRDRNFRHAVLRAYECRCAVCGFDLRLEDELLGLEAAHIKWHSAGGPSKVPNGLALCSIHHKALDRGALGLAPVAGEFKVLISAKVQGESDTTRWFWDCHGTPLRHPRSSEFKPRAEFVKWHAREVFRHPPRDSPSQPTLGSA